MNYIKFFIFGILAALGAIVTELILSALFSILFNINIETNYSDRITFFLFVAVFTEEAFKISLLWKLFSALQEPSSRIMLAIFFGSGFAFFEISSKLISYLQYDFSMDFFSGLLGVFLIHTILSVMVGYFFSQRSGITTPLFLAILLSTSVFHLVYNLIIIYEKGAIFIGGYIFSICTLLYLVKNKLAK